MAGLVIKEKSKKSITKHSTEYGPAVSGSHSVVFFILN